MRSRRFGCAGSSSHAVSTLDGDLLDPLSKQCPQDLPCRVHDGDLWFARRPADLERAKELCRACPARVMCLSEAVARREPCGVWGGEIFQDGAIIARKRPVGRPPKVRC